MKSFDSVMEALRKLREAAKKIENAEMQNLIADLSLEVAELKAELAARKEEITELRQALSARDDVSALRAKMEVRGQVLYFREPEKGRPEGPYCPTCFDTQEKLVLLTAMHGAFRELGNFKCNHCKATF